MINAVSRALALVIVISVTAISVPQSASAASGTSKPEAPTVASTAENGQVTKRGSSSIRREDNDFSGTAAYSKYFRQRVTWSAKNCPRDSNGEITAYMECARVRAPRDWYHLSAGDITIGVSRLGGPLSQPRKSRLLLSNPGGPGGPGLEFGLVAALFLGLTDTHTAIGIDPRGVGMSTNLVCPDIQPSKDGYLADGDSRSFTPESVAIDAKDTARYFATCRAARGNLLPFINSDQTARDFNLVRKILGYTSFDYYGVSYGTWLGAVLEKKFPSKVNRIVLDGNVDWTSASFDSIFASVPMSVQASFDRVFLPWLGRHNSVYGLGSSAAEVDSTIERLRAAAGAGTFGPEISPNAMDALVTGALYSTLQWDGTASVLKGLVRVADGDPTGLPDLVAAIQSAAGSDTASASTYLAVRCNDTQTRLSPSTWFYNARKRANAYPLAGSQEMSPLCAAWPYPRVISPALMARPMSGVLMLQTEADPVTGYDGALHTRLTQTGQLRMLNVDDAPGHGAGLLSSDCAAKAAHDYLSKGTYPRTELYCASTPISSGAVSDKHVYEFFNQASPKRKLPAPYVYSKRDLSEPRIDTSVPVIATNPALPPVKAPAPGSLSSTMPSWSNPWAEAFAKALVNANQSSVAPALIPAGG